MISYDYVNLVKESVIFNEKDIYYNKEKFDSGEINLCFITAISGGGKTTIAKKIAENSNAEHYELDDLVWNKMKFTMNNMKEYGDLFYSFFNGIGRKYWYTEDDVKDGKVKPIDNYEEFLINDFIKYCKNYANSHKNKKYVVEGVWLVDFCKPEDFKDYAFYIKGTSLLVSRWRAAKRDSKDAPKGKVLFARIHNFTSLQLLKANYDFEKDLNKFRNYFKNLMKEKEVTEACKDLSTARKFASEVKELAKKYNANFYLVTDGASATNNDGTNAAVKFARDSMKKWEAENGFDPKEDWSKDK